MWNGILTKWRLSGQPGPNAPQRVIAPPPFKVGDFATKPSPGYTNAILMRRLDFQEDELRRGDADPIRAVTTEIESWPNISPSDRPGDPRRLAVPFQHLIIQAPGTEIYGSFALDLASELDRRFGHLVEGFSVQVVPSVSRSKEDMKVFFGLGIYYPDRLSPLVGTVQLRYADVRPTKDSPGVSPVIGNMNAGWYHGQGGLCLAFRPGLAPATVDLEDAGVPRHVAEQLEDVVVFLGRESETSRSEVRLVPTADTGATARLAVRDPHMEWHRPTTVERRDRAGNAWSLEEPWREVQIAGVKLWLRFEPHTGASGFTTRRPEPVPRTEQVSEARPHWVSVVGLVMPSRVGLMARGMGWWVDFDANGDLRDREPTGRRLSLVQRSKGPRLPFAHLFFADEGFSLFDHQKCTALFPTYEDNGEPSIRLRPGMTLHRYQREPTELVKIPGEGLGNFTQDNVTRQALRAIYGDEVSIIGFREPMASFGCFALRSEHRYVVKAEPIEPSFLRQHAPLEPGTELSLDWLNRAAGVGLQSPEGLASHWLSRIESLQLVIKAGGVLHIDCKAADQDGRVFHVELPPNGAYGLMGPLFIRHEGSDENA